MKQYQIIIKGRGPHHEGHATGNRSRDADFVLAEFLEKIRGLGHEITIAAFSADNTTEMLVGSPRDVNHLDEIYGISSNPAEDETKEDTGAVSMADLLNEIQGLREEQAHTHQTLVNFIDYEKDEDSDDPKAPKKRKTRAKKEAPETVTPPVTEHVRAGFLGEDGYTPPESKTVPGEPEGRSEDKQPGDHAAPQAGEDGASAQTQEAEGKPAEEQAQQSETTAPPEA